MPIFEFDCKKCGQSFEKMLSSASQISEVVCPGCGSCQVVKRVSRLASYGSGGLSFSPNTMTGGCKTSKT